MAHTVMTMIENIHSQIQEVLNDNVNKLDVQNALYQLEEVRDIVDILERENNDKIKTTLSFKR
jgi:hypothetical protein